MYLYVTKDGDFIGLDQASGGYPYETNSPMSAHVWSDKQTALDYLSKSELKHGWILKKFNGLNLSEA